MNTTHRLRLHVLDETIAVCRLAATAPVPEWADGSGFVSTTRTRDELSIACPQERVPPGVVHQPGYRVLAVEGPLAPDLIGVLRSLAAPLADAGVPILAIGTFDTDYVLVRAADLDHALDALRLAGHVVA